MQQFNLISDYPTCRYNHRIRPLDRIAHNSVSTDAIVNSEVTFPVKSRIVIVDLCKTDIVPAVVAGLTLRNKGYLVVFDLCSDDPTDLIHDLYNRSVEELQERIVRGEAIVAEPALHLSLQIDRAIRFFEREFL